MRDRERGERDGKRGQSELLGFLLIFAVVVLTIALVGVTGFVGLDGAQDYQRTANAEQAFTALADNVDDVVRRGAPSRTTEVRIADASLSFEEANTTIAIDGENGTETVVVETAPLVYDSGTDTSLTYRDGAVIRQDGEDSVMLREPSFLLTDGLVVLPVAELSPDGAGAIGGTRDVDVRTRSGGTEVLAAGETVDSVTVALTTPHADVWAAYFRQFEDGPVTDVSTDEDGVTVTIEADRLYVTVDRIDASFR